MVSPSPLLSLPAELRNDVFSLFLNQDLIVEIPISCQVFRPALLRTCRQINAEASLIYYSNTEFHATITADEDLKLVAWLTCIGEANAKAIPSISISCDLTAAMKERCFRRHWRGLPPTPIFDEAMGMISTRKVWEHFATNLFRTGLKSAAIYLIGLEDKMEEGYQVWAYRAQQQQAFENGMMKPLSRAMRNEALSGYEELVEARAEDS